jgi:hypothetical protein
MWPLIWSLVKSKLGIIAISLLVLGGFGIYHKITMWNEQRKIETMVKERDNALRDLQQEKVRTMDLEKAIQFQREQLTLQQRIKKGTSDVKQAVTSNDRDFLYNNFVRLYNYRNPKTNPESSGGNIKRLIPKAKAKTPE